MRIHESGPFVFSVLFLFRNVAIPNVIIPMRPKNINRITMIDDEGARLAVMPCESPHIVIAETASKMTPVNGSSGWINAIEMAPIKQTVSMTSMTDSALMICLGGIVRLKTVKLLLPRRDFIADKKSTPTVAFFIPPAVDPADPPISIKIIISIFEISLSFA